MPGLTETSLFPLALEAAGHDAGWVYSALADTAIRDSRGSSQNTGGNTVLNRFLNTNVRRIVIFSRDEKKQEDMRVALRNSKVQFCIGDVRDYHSIAQAMQGVDYVFHAAALKQVPSCEFFPMEATRTNVL
eukprot:gene7856-biopygen6591